MSTETSYTVSQDLVIQKPRSRPVLMVPCQEWDYLKEKLGRVTRTPWIMRTLGSAFLGAALSVTASILSGAMASTATGTAWWWVGLTGAVGSLLLFTARRQRQMEVIDVVGDVVTQMDLIEARQEITER